jgi:hypothetical protein
MARAKRRRPEDRNPNPLTESQMQNVVLALLFATSWRESQVENLRRSWKGYPFETLDALAEAGLVTESRGRRSLFVTPEGQLRAAEALARIAAAV